MEDKVRIDLTRDTRRRLRETGHKSETWDQILNRLMNISEIFQSEEKRESTNTA